MYSLLQLFWHMINTSSSAFMGFQMVSARQFKVDIVPGFGGLLQKLGPTKPAQQ